MSLPVSLRIAERRVVVIGGGIVALRKCRSLAAAGAQLYVVAPAIHPELKTLLREPSSYVERAYRAGDLAEAFLAVAATDDDAVNALVVADARAARVLVVDATSAHAGDAIMLATTTIGEMTIAVDSGGSTPAFARRVVEEARSHFGESYGRAAGVLAYARVYVKALLAPEERAPVLRALSDLPVEALARMTPADIEHEAEAAIERLHGGTLEPRTHSVRCASRGSELALTQARAVAAKLAQRGIASTIVKVRTLGDRVTDRPVHALERENVFVTELESALRDGRADYAVHSCKDLPSALAADMELAAISAREDPRDAFCSDAYERFADLPAGARVGTSSPRRRAQLAALRPDLEYVDLRGNVDTRLRKLREGEFAAIVLAMAGLNRLKAAARYTVPFETSEIVPAAGQGALAVETRTDSSALAQQLRAAINDQHSELTITAERATLHALRAGCSAPIGVFAALHDGSMHVDVAYALDHHQPAKIVRARCIAAVTTPHEAQALGERTARQLRELLPLAGRTVLLPRTQARASTMAAQLREAGANVIELRAGAPADGRPADLIVFPSSASVMVADAVLHDRPPRITVAAMGPKSAAAAAAAGWHPDIVATEATIDALVGQICRRLEPQPL